MTTKKHYVLRIVTKSYFEFGSVLLLEEATLNRYLFAIVHLNYLELIN